MGRPALTAHSEAASNGISMRKYQYNHRESSASAAIEMRRIISLDKRPNIAWHVCARVSIYKPSARENSPSNREYSWPLFTKARTLSGMKRPRHSASCPALSLFQTPLPVARRRRRRIARPPSFRRRKIALRYL